MKKFTAKVTTLSYSTATVTVEAVDEAQARAKVRSHVYSGDVVWKYDGVAEGPGQGPEITSIVEDS